MATTLFLEEVVGRIVLIVEEMRQIQSIKGNLISRNIMKSKINHNSMI